MELRLRHQHHQHGDHFEVGLGTTEQVKTETSSLSMWSSRFLPEPETYRSAMSITKNMNFELELTNRKCAVDYYYPHFLHMPFHTFMHNATLSDALWD